MQDYLDNQLRELLFILELAASDIDDMCNQPTTTDHAKNC